MINALVSDKLSHATPKTRGFCPFCKSVVISKCGRINEWHWAHESISNCDNWNESEGIWHHGWKQIMLRESNNIKVEQIIKGFDEEKHIDSDGEWIMIFPFIYKNIGW